MAESEGAGMIILTRKKQKKILSKIIELDNILDDYPEAKIKTLHIIADIVSETSGIDGLLTMANYSEIKAFEALGEQLKVREEE